MSARLYRRFLIIILLSLIFLIEIGYASFSTESYPAYYFESSNTFDVRFEDACVVKSVGTNIDESLIAVSPSGKSLNVNVSKLQYPGAGIEFSVDVVNYGDTRARVETIVINGLDESDDILVNILNKNIIEKKELGPNESCNIHFTVIWDYNSTKEIKDTKSFNLIIYYKQAI